MTDLIPLKITITRAEQNNYPPFNDIPVEIRKGLDWAVYIDRHGSGLLYDVKSGFNEVDEENPDPHTLWCFLMVPEDFAREAIARFPGQVMEIDEAEFERCYNERCALHQPDETVDPGTLQGILAQLQIERDFPGVMPPISGEKRAAMRRALDPADRSPGVRANPNRTYKGFKAMRGLTVAERLRKRER